MAWVGVVPRRYSTGTKQKLFGISKCGNRYFRRMLIFTVPVPCCFTSSTVPQDLGGGYTGWRREPVTTW